MKRLPRWKREQVARKQQSLKRIVSAFSFFISACFLFVLVFLFFFSSKFTEFGDFDRLTFVISGNESTVVSLSLVEMKASVITIPSDILISFPSSSTQYRIGAIESLDMMRQKKGGLFLNAFRMLLGAPVEKRLFVFENTSFNSSSDIKKFFSYANFLKNIRLRTSRNSQAGDFSLLELVQLWFFMSQLRNDKIEFYSLSENLLVRDIIFPDESKASEINLSALDYFLEQAFFEKRIVQEHYTVDVQNGTGITGQALSVNRMLSNMGADVISATKMDALRAQTTICVKDAYLLKSYTIRRFVKFFSSKAIPCLENSSRADIVVILGQDYFFRWN